MHPWHGGVGEGGTSTGLAGVAPIGGGGASGRGGGGASDVWVNRGGEDSLHKGQARGYTKERAATSVVTWERQGHGWRRMAVGRHKLVVGGGTKAHGCWERPQEGKNQAARVVGKGRFDVSHSWRPKIP